MAWETVHTSVQRETWLVCERCNRELETPSFKASARNTSYAYQAAVLIFMAEAQQELKLFDGRH